MNAHPLNDQTVAAASGSYAIGGDLPVVRLGYGTMQLTGEGVWGAPKDPDEAVRVLRRAVDRRGVREAHRRRLSTHSPTPGRTPPRCAT